MVSDTRLLIADTDAAVRGIIRISAQEEGWSFDEAGDGITALKLLRRNTFKLPFWIMTLRSLTAKSCAGKFARVAVFR